MELLVYSYTVMAVIISGYISHLITKWIMNRKLKKQQKEIARLINENLALKNSHNTKSGQVASAS